MPHLSPWQIVNGLLRQLWAASTDAVTNAFPAQAHYKNILHRAIGGSVELLGVSLFVERAFFS